MLILTRKQGESITIGNTVIRILSTTRGRVKLGIISDAGVPIRRSGQAPDNQPGDPADE